MTNISRESFTCEFCEMRFHFKSAHVPHTNRVHLKIERFSCDDCGKGFYLIGDLNKHIRSVHLDIKRFSCTDCNYSSFDKKGLECHYDRVHKRLRPLTCTQCYKTFYSNGGLKRHVKAIHLNLRPHICKFCDWAFHSNDNMEIHIKRKHLDPLMLNMSRGEKAVSEALEGVEHVREKKFSDLKGFGGGYLRYDFAIEIGKDEENYILIEFDGKQHFQPARFKGDIDDMSALERFNLRKRHDRVKNKYAEIHGYPLLRIKYDQIKVVKKLVEEFLKNNT